MGSVVVIGNSEYYGLLLVTALCNLNNIYTMWGSVVLNWYAISFI